MSGPDCCRTEMLPCWRRRDHQDDCPARSDERRRSSLTCMTQTVSCWCKETLLECCWSLTLRMTSPGHICCSGPWSTLAPCCLSSPSPLRGTGRCCRWQTPVPESVSTPWLLCSTNSSPHSKHQKMKSVPVWESCWLVNGQHFSTLTHLW